MILLVVVLLISVGVCFLPWQHDINTTLEGVQCRINDNEYIEKITITVKGKYNQYLFKDDVFIGNISINLYGDIWSLENGKLVFSDNNAPILKSKIGNNGYCEIENFGNILCTENFSEILILVSEKTETEGTGWTSENGLYISAPAKTKEDAINIADKLRKRSVWLSQGSWE